MRKFFYILVFVQLVSVKLPAESKAEKEVAAAVERLKRALVEGKREQLEEITAETLSYGHSGGRLEDKAGFVETLANGTSDFVTLELSDQTIQVSGNTAIVRHKLAAQIADNGKPASINLWVLLVFQKQKGDWKLLARQAVKTGS